MTRPTERMGKLASRWLTDRVTLRSQTVDGLTRPGDAGPTFGTGYEVAALVRQDRQVELDGQTVRRVQRELSVWIDPEASVATLVAAGWRIEFTATGDATVTGETGTVVQVERDGFAPVRRLTVRLANDA